MSADKRFLYISIPIEEGEIYQIGKLDFKGELLLTRDEMVRGLKVKEGDTFNRTKLSNDIRTSTTSTRIAATPTSTSRR
jgi:outer membrane protein insertion porin family